mgnify:CR=1 FL=1
MESKSGESKSESKEERWAKEDKKFSKDEGAVPEVDVHSIILPSDPEGGTDKPLGSALELIINFSLDMCVRDALWEVKFLVDCANERVIKILGCTPRETLVKGKNTMRFTADSIDFSSIKKSTLANAGLLMAGLLIEGEEVCTVNMVVNVSQNDSTGALTRQILNPLA